MTVNKELLSLSGRRRARAALVASFRYLVHSSAATNLESIRAHGLLPRPKEFAADVEPAVVTKAFDGIRPDIVCLTTPILPVQGSHEGPSVVFAIRTDDLPATVCLDWSYAGTWGWPDRLLRQRTCTTSDQAFLETFRELRSVVVLEIIPPNKLRVRHTASMAEDPSEWPCLLDAEPSAVFRSNALVI